MSVRISVSELDRQVNEILNRVYYRRESFIVERFGKEMARIEPVGPSRFASAQEIADRLGDMRVPEGLAYALEEMQATQRGFPRRHSGGDIGALLRSSGCQSACSPCGRSREWRHEVSRPKWPE